MKVIIVVAKFVAACLFTYPLWAQEARVENGTLVPASNALSRSVALFKLSGGGSCSASFLTKKTLLTAAHCTKSASASGSSIKVRDSSGAWHTAKIAKIFTHPKYKQAPFTNGVRINYDVGVVVLKAELPFAVRPLKLGSAEYLRENPTPVTVVGYGWNSQGGGAGTLRRGRMVGEVMELANFYDRDGIYMEPETNQVVCPGDSGGAVLKGDSTSTTLIGVHSLSSGCQGDGPNGHSMSEIAYSHKTWIKSVASDVL